MSKKLTAEEIDTTFNRHKETFKKLAEETYKVREGIEEQMESRAMDVNGQIVVPLDEAIIHAKAFIAMSKRIGAQSRLKAIAEEANELLESRKQAGIDSEYDFSTYKEAHDDFVALIQQHLQDDNLD